MRYADDIVILTPAADAARQALELVQGWMEGAQLTLHPDKTSIVDMSQADSRFDFPGYRFQRSRQGKLLRLIRPKSRQNLRENLGPMTRRASGKSLPAIIAMLNPEWRGIKRQPQSAPDAVAHGGSPLPSLILPPGKKPAASSCGKSKSPCAPGGASKPRTIRLWTSLLDPVEHPAPVLTGLYTARWEEELFFRELKTHVHGAHPLLHAQAVESAAMESDGPAARRRRHCGAKAWSGWGRRVPVLKISLAQVLAGSRALFEILEAGRGVLSRSQQAEITRRVLERLFRTAIIRPRKKRSCQRALRQPIKSWPKMRSPTSSYPTITIVITDVNP